jgi:hypothetical protein
VISGWPHILDLLRGEVTIVSGFLTAFLGYHLIKVGAQRHLIHWTAWAKLPLSMQLAVAISTVAASTFLITLGYPEFRILSIIGFFCALRVTTRPALNEPIPFLFWYGALLCGGIYLGWMAAQVF